MAQNQILRMEFDVQHQIPLRAEPSFHQENSVNPSISAKSGSGPFSASQRTTSPKKRHMRPGQRPAHIVSPRQRPPLPPPHKARHNFPS